MLKKENLYHAIEVNEDYYDTDKTLEKLEKIIQDGYLYSRRLQKDLDRTKGGFQGLDYISFCDNEKKNARPYQGRGFYKGYTAYQCYIAKSLSLGFKKEHLKIIIPTLIAPTIFDWDSLETMRILGLEKKRYSDMPDEVQIKNKVSLKNLVCLTLPIHLMQNNKRGLIYTENQVLDHLATINSILTEHELNVPIYDLFSRTNLDKEEKVRKVIQKYKI